MTAAPLHRTAPPVDPDDITADILRALRDAQTPVLVSDLDAAHPDRRAVSAALTRLARGGLVDIAAGHVTISPAHLRRESEKPEHPQPPPPNPTHQPPKPAPSTSDILRLITQTLVAHGPMTPAELADHLPRATHVRLTEAINLGTATGRIGCRDNRLFAVTGPTTPRHRVRRRGGVR